MDGDTLLTIDLYVRTDIPTVERRDAVIEQLERLKAQGRIDEYQVHSWPRAISLDLLSDVEGRRVYDVVRTFDSWTSRHDRDMHPAFDVKQSRSIYTGESDELLVLPVLTLAAYRDDELVEVAPCCHDGSVCTVEDVLEALSTGREPAVAAQEGASPGSEPELDATERVAGSGALLTARGEDGE